MPLPDLFVKFKRYSDRVSHVEDSVAPLVWDVEHFAANLITLEQPSVPCICTSTQRRKILLDPFRDVLQREKGVVRR